MSKPSESSEVVSAAAAIDSIDVHAHVVPDHFPAYTGRFGSQRWPAISQSCGKHTLVIGGENFRALSVECWDLERRLLAMDRAGIRCQALSPMPELLSYWLPEEDALTLGRFVNDQIGSLCERSRGRCVGLGTVPLQTPAVAARELESLMLQRVFRGVEIGTHVNGVPIGDPRFDDFFSAAESLGAAVFVHALHPVGAERLVGPPVLSAAVGYPCELAFCISSVITGGLMQRHPNLRVCFSHGGGAFALVLPRLAHVWGKSDALKANIPNSPIEIARRFFYDDLVYDLPTLRHLVSTFGDTQLVIGTDFPFLIQDPSPLASVEALQLDVEAAHRLRHANAKRFLGISNDLEH